MWVLDLSGQHLGAGCVVVVSVRPLGVHCWGILICIEYMLPTLWGFFLLFYISCQQFWDECKLGSFCAFQGWGYIFYFLFVFEITTIATQEIMTHHYL